MDRNYQLSTTHTNNTRHILLIYFPKMLVFEDGLGANTTKHAESLIHDVRD